MDKKRRRTKEELQEFLNKKWDPKEAAELFAEQLAELLWRHWLYTQSQKKKKKIKQ